jgi:hypothetical protein
LSRYGFSAFGEFFRNLSNSNQNLILSDAFGNTIDNVYYYDSAPWPTNADGGGSYLQLIDTALDNNLASSWVATNTLSIPEIEISNNITVSPNPTSDIVNINSPNDISKIEVLDLEGRIINKIEINSNLYSIDFRNYANGIYLLKINQNNKIIIRKIIKKTN